MFKIHLFGSRYRKISFCRITPVLSDLHWLPVCLNTYHVQKCVCVAQNDQMMKIVQLKMTTVKMIMMMKMRFFIFHDMHIMFPWFHSQQMNTTLYFLFCQMTEIIIKLCVQYAVLNAKFTDNLILLIQTTLPWIQLANTFVYNMLLIMLTIWFRSLFILHPLSYCLLS